MTDAEVQLAIIGFAAPREAPVAWCVARCGPPASVDTTANEPADSPALRYWRAVLARQPRPSPYRIACLGR